MLFSSITFLYLFLPGVLILYFLIPGRAKKYVLLIASLIFYAWGEPKYVWLMLLEIGIAYGAGLLIEKCKNRALESVVFGASLLIIIVLLGYFKYGSLFQKTLGQIAGISFYSFQIISVVKLL